MFPNAKFDGQKPWVSGPITLTTDKGTSIEADLVLRCTGFKVNADAYRSKLSDKMDHNTGTLKVNKYLQVEEMNDVFAVGDCNNTDEMKLGYVAGIQGGKIILSHQHNFAGTLVPPPPLHYAP